MAKLRSESIARFSFHFSIPFVGALPGLVAQQKAELSPQAPQVCVTSLFESFPLPTTVI